MRLIARIANHNDAQEFSFFLTKEGIGNALEESGSEMIVWVKDEEDVEKANQWFVEFRENRDDPKFHGHAQIARQVTEQQVEREQESAGADIEIARKAGIRPRFGKLTIATLLTCVALFFFGSIRVIPIGKTGEALVLTSTVYHSLLYDYPETFALFNELGAKTTPEELQEPNALPAPQKKLLQKALTTPYWMGFYPLLLKAFGAPDHQKLQEGPLFEKIGEGEVWRIFTPALLHANFWHILFNMLWLILLSNQMEQRMGWFRLALFVLITAIVSNTAQYLMSGPAFMGFSGVICAMLGFIWMRQWKTPWEGYQLTKGTIIFILIYILGMFALQAVGFFFELYGRSLFVMPIANTAHIIGGIIGALLGGTALFAIRTPKARQ